MQDDASAAVLNHEQAEGGPRLELHNEIVDHPDHPTTDLSVVVNFPTTVEHRDYELIRP